jgi:hypothetical protein
VIKKAVLLSGLMAWAISSQAQATCQSVGTQHPCYDANSVSTTTQRAPSATPNGNGTSETAPLVGKQHRIPFSDRTSASSQQVGGERFTTYGNGVTATTQQVGSQSFTTYNNGRTASCQMVGTQRVCN